MAPDSVVLAGPIVRRVDEQSVAVWIATSAAASLDLTIRTRPSSGSGQLVAEGRTTTRQFSGGFHAAVVVAKLPDASKFAANTVHEYDIHVDGVGLQALGLLTTKVLADGLRQLPLGFDENVLPTFVSPPAKIDDLRIAHASCRRPGAGRLDALAGKKIA